MRQLIISGDSYTFGSELKDKSWAELLSINLGYSYKNVSQPGIGNAGIARKVIEELNHDTAGVLIMWTFLCRFDFYVDNNWETTTINDKSTFSTTFMKHVGKSEYYELHNTLINVLLLQSLLEKYKIPYLFTSAESSWLSLYYANTPWIRKLIKEVDWSKWYNIDNGQGFCNWAANKYEHGSRGHPLDQAHIDLVKNITPLAIKLIGFAN